MDVLEIKQDIKELRSDVQDLKVVAAQNTAILETHIRRTELNEERIVTLEKWLLGLLGAILVAAVVAALRSQ